jgi:hypothetical protein
VLRRWATCVVALLVLPLLSPAAVIPTGTQLEIRLKSQVASSTSKAQDAVEAVLIRPVMSGTDVVLPAGTAVHGVVKEAVPIKSATDRAALDLDFSKLTLPAGGTLKMAAKVVEVGNARESVADTGRITGILASETLAARIQSGVERVGQKYSRLGGFLEGMKSAVLQEPEPEIVFGPGVEMTLELTKPLEGAAVAAPAAILPVTPAAAILKTVNSQPFQTTTQEPPPIPSDLTNLMFLGTQEQLESAFTAAGWSSAARLNTVSGLEVFRAVAEMRGYKEAPMSVLLLDGRPPDLDYEKQNNTFAKRHHLRIWRRPATFQGMPVWVCAATHDTGIEFSPEKRNFIHKIDSEIDRERAKVVNDLLFSGHVKALSLVARPDAPQHSENATGDKLETDGRMAVLALE